MAHLEHFKACDIKRLANEYSRNENYKCLDNRIDSARTLNNYVMDSSVNDITEALEKRLSEVPHMKRKDLNVLSSWVVTCPQELKDDKQQRERFFELTYAFIKARYGDDNVLQGFVHMDESTPHIHVSVVAVKDNRISAKKLFNKAELRNFHKELESLMEREYGMPGLILNGRTKGGYSTAELKERTRKENELNSLETSLNVRRSDLEAQAEELSIDRRKVLKKANTLSEREKELQEREQKLETDKQALEERFLDMRRREIAVNTKEFELQQREEILEKREKEQQRFLVAGRKALSGTVSENVTANAVRKRRDLPTFGG